MKVLESSESNYSEPEIENIVLKKSTFNKLIIGIVATSIVAAFLGVICLESKLIIQKL